MSINLNAFDPFNLDVPTTEGGFGDSTLILKIPGPENPLIVKLLPEPIKGRAYLPVNYYKYAVGPNPKTDSRSRPSRASLGLGDKDLENEQKWVGITQLSAMKKANPATYREDPKFKAIQAIVKIFEASEGGWAFVVEPESETIKALKLNKSMLNHLFGRKGEGQVKPIASVVDALHKKGKSPYKMADQDTWLRIYKTGEGLATEYFVEHHTTLASKEIEGETVEYKKAVVLNVNKKFLAGTLEVSDYPEPLKFDEKQVFTVEETKEFIETQGNIFPERFGKKTGGGERNKDAASDDSYTTTSTESFAGVSSGVIDLNSIPF